MTMRMDSMPCLAEAVARWDAESNKVRYYASFEGQEDNAKWVEVSGEDFDRLTRLFTQEAIDAICHQIYETLDHVKATLADFSAFREGLEKLSDMAKPRTEGSN